MQRILLRMLTATHQYTRERHEFLLRPLCERSALHLIPDESRTLVARPILVPSPTTLQPIRINAGSRCRDRLAPPA